MTVPMVEGSGEAERTGRQYPSDMAGRPLNDTEIEAYDVVSPELARKVRVYRIRFIPGGYAGMTIGRNVLLANDVTEDGNSALMAHELVHARQWEDLGLVGFSRRYATSFARNLIKHKRWHAAYRDIEAEVEARNETTDWLRRKTRDGLADNV